MTDKVIFIFDRPKECCECPCFDESDYCKAIDESASLEGIRSDCPLRPLPQKIVGKQEKYMPAYALGRNDVIDEITGETEWPK